jgi:hypothetical protein
MQQFMSSSKPTKKFSLGNQYQFPTLNQAQNEVSP